MISVPTNAKVPFTPFGVKKETEVERNVESMMLDVNQIIPPNSQMANFGNLLQNDEPKDGLFSGLREREFKRIYEEQLEKEKNKEKIQSVAPIKNTEFAKETAKKNEKREKENEEAERKKHRQILLASIEGYFQSPRFKSHLHHLDRSRAELQKMSTKALDDLISEIRDILANRTKMAMVTNMSVTVAGAYESVVSPFCDIQGFSTILHHNEEYQDFLEQMTIETHLPYMPWWSRVLMIYYHMSILAYSMNENKKNSINKRVMEGVINENENTNTNTNTNTNSGKQMLNNYFEVIQ